MKFIYSFSSEEIILCSQWAQEIWARKGHIPSEGWTAQDWKKDSHYGSKLAEIAAGHFLGLDPDWELFWGGDPGYDLVMPNGQTIDVKFAEKRWYGFRLHLDDMSWFKADYGVLVIPVQEDDMLSNHEIVGYISREEFDRRKERKNFGRGNRFVVEQPNLDPFQELIDYVQSVRNIQ